MILNVWALWVILDITGDMHGHVYCLVPHAARARIVYTYFFPLPTTKKGSPLFLESQEISAICLIKQTKNKKQATRFHKLSLQVWYPCCRHINLVPGMNKMYMFVCVRLCECARKYVLRKEKNNGLLLL